VAADHFDLVPPIVPLQPISFSLPGTAHTPTTNMSTIEHNNIYEVLAQQDNGTTDTNNDILSFGSISGGNTTTSGSMGNRGKEPIPLTP
jgi:hypothetical protein